MVLSRPCANVRLCSDSLLCHHDAALNKKEQTNQHVTLLGGQVIGFGCFVSFRQTPSDNEYYLVFHFFILSLGVYHCVIVQRNPTS